MTLSEARKQANKKWNDKNKEKRKSYVAKSTTKKYISTANADTLKEIKKMINTREELINNVKWFNDEVAIKMMKMDGQFNVLAILGSDLLEDENNPFEDIDATKAYVWIMDDEDDLYTLEGAPSYDIEKRFLNDYRNLPSNLKSEIIERFVK